MEVIVSLPENKVTVHSPADLAAAVPYLIGFHPSDGSVVVIACNGRRIVFAARGDLPAGSEYAHQLDAFADQLIPVVQRQQPLTHVVIIGYGTPDSIDPALRALDGAFVAAGLPVVDLLRAAGDRLFSLICANPACCPPQGTPFDPIASTVAVRATIAGVVVRPDRASVAGQITPVRGAARDAIQRASREARIRLEALRVAGGTAMYEAGERAVRDALRRHDAGARLTDDEVAWLTTLLVNRDIRDLAVGLTEPHSRHVDFWADITRRAHEPLVPAPATLLAVTAWRCGDGVLAAMAAEHALHIDGSYQFADTVLQALQAGVPPTVVEEVLADAESEPTALPDDPMEQE
ncbi:DUF4192 domain-containing protein [Micromonospora aurantiaca]|uniref:DUF4192 domain-containing protein n=1 Tax=Micromonospora aurantiaca (nom. illeg.) TaxID=47850 RepID=UPI001E5FB1B7|nr:DUF4192 domain-containing protein [Micromonospora aurantiaca]UFN96777.1 DUF4192 domain-containing protein [Micromonospora aurantiaca]